MRGAGMTAREIIRTAREQGQDPIEFTEDLADGYGWEEAMTESAIGAVRHLLAREKVYGR